MEDVNNSKYIIDQPNVESESNIIPWRKLERNIFKLQKRIDQASKCNDIKKVRSLQRLLFKSASVKMLAAKGLTQDEASKEVTGVDGKAHLNQQHAKVKEIQSS